MQDAGEEDWHWEDSKNLLTTTYDGISCGLQNLVDFEASWSGAWAPLILIKNLGGWAHKNAAFDSLCEMLMTSLSAVQSR